MKEVMDMEEEEFENLLTPGKVARIFSVCPTTVTRWANAGKLTAVRTPGNQRRYRESEVRELLAATMTERVA